MDQKILAYNTPIEIETHQSLKATRFQIYPKALLNFYWVIPMSWIVVLIDNFVLNKTFQQTLPKSPDEIFIFSMIFTTPHVLASSFSFFDIAYIKYYKKQLRAPLLFIIAVAIILPNIIGFTLFAGLFIVLTIIHTVGQQFGMSLMLTKANNINFQLWKWSGLAIAIPIYLDIAFDLSSRFLLGNIMFYLSLFLFIPFTTFTILYTAKCKQSIGYIAIWLNYLLVLNSCFLYYIKYTFFTFLTLRIIHDCSAFAFYMVHDQNRNAQQFNNFLYRPLSRLGVPILILCPLFAITLSYLYNQNRGVYWLEILIVILSLFHYYTDSFTWKNGSLHRQAIFIK